jgi:hypothetical protein
VGWARKATLAPRPFPDLLCIIFTISHYKWKENIPTVLYCDTCRVTCYPTPGTTVQIGVALSVRWQGSWPNLTLGGRVSSWTCWYPSWKEKNDLNVLQPVPGPGSTQDHPITVECQPPGYYVWWQLNWNVLIYREFLKYHITNYDYTQMGAGVLQSACLTADWTTGVRSLAEVKDFSLACVQANSETHPASYPVGTGVFLRG